MSTKQRIYICLATAGAIAAGSPAASGSDERSPTTYDRIWRHATLYENDSNPSVQKFALSGRLQPESAWFDAEQGDFSDDFLWRRFRFGFKADVFRQWVLHLEGDFDLNNIGSRIYGRLTDAYIGWSPADNLELKFLKQSVGFTLDGATSSKRLLAMQRNDLTNNLWFTREYFVGGLAKGEAGERWSYRAGIFSNEDHDEISRLEAGYFTLLSVGREYEGVRVLDHGLIRLDYVYNQEDENAGTRPFSHVLSLVTEWEAEEWGMRTDLAAGSGFGGQSDVWGWVFMPFYNFDPRYQLVFRFTFVKSKGENGVRLPRYASRIVDGRGELYREAYVGLNVYFYGHKLKWQTGIELGDMQDDANDGGQYRGIGLNTGIRIYW